MDNLLISFTRLTGCFFCHFITHKHSKKRKNDCQKVSDYFLLNISLDLIWCSHSWLRPFKWTTSCFSVWWLICLYFDFVHAAQTMSMCLCNTAERNGINNPSCSLHKGWCIFDCLHWIGCAICCFAYAQTPYFCI